MINEEKLKLMTKLAMYEQNEGRKAFSLNKLFKRDYVSLYIIQTAVITTICYVMLLFVWVIYKVDYFMANIAQVNIPVLIAVIVIIYLILMAFYLIFAYFYYTKKYNKIKKNLVNYYDNLKVLQKIYKNESINKQDKDTGGSDKNVETFST